LNCYNDSSGAIDLTVSGGVPPYNFAWSNGSTFEDIYGLHAGTYSVTVNDANGCIQNLTQSVTQPTLLATSIAVTNVSCAGALNGAIDLSVSGGTPGYNYLWSNGVTTQDLTGLAGGTYTVVVTDSKGCNAVNTATVNEGLPLSVTAVVTNILCNGNATGVINITVNGGTAPYSYIWSNNSTNEDQSGLAAGNYIVTVTDFNGCSATASYTITQPAALTVVQAGYADVSCFGGNNGSIDINVYGGTPLYTYLWSNASTSEDLNGLSIGTYSVTVADFNGCSATASYSINQPTALSLSLTTTNVTCPGAANGSIDLTVAGGVSPYTYLWNNGTTTQDLTNITGGNYTVIVTDANSCTAAASIVVNEGAPLIITGVVTNVPCNGGTTGAVDVTVSGGNAPYTYAWSNGYLVQDLFGVAAGSYTLSVTDQNGCSATASFTITQPTALLMSASVINVTCNGGNNGLIDVTVNGGVFPYSFAWSNGSTNEDAYSLNAGNYSLTVTDANGCTLVQSFTVTQPFALITFTQGVDVSCNGASDGAANLAVSGGTPPYSYLWSTFQGSEDITGLSGGLYFVIVTDANGCEKKDSVLINEPAPLNLTTAITNISCYNSNDGAIDLTVTGGTTPYTYAWSNGASSQDLSSLQNGVYAVTVTDAHACSATTSVVIINPSVITANFFTHNPLCFGSTDGSIDLIPSGGTPSFTFQWSNGATSEDISSLGPGTYIVTLTDSKGCTRIDSATLTEPLPLVTSGFIKNVTCYGFADGFVDITAYGGTLPYAFQWSNGPSTEDIGALTGGSYYVTVTDANGCQAATLYPVLEPAQLTVDVVGTNVACFGGKTGSVAAIPAGGRTPYYYLWNTFDTDSSVSGLSAGKYTVQLTDSSGCFTYDSLIITQPTAINITGVVTDAVCYGAATGAVDVAVAGGVPNYTYVWSNGNLTEDLINVAADTYVITVTDANGCNKAATFTVGQGNQITVGIANFNPICHGGNSGSLTAIVSGGQAPYSYNWGTTPAQTGISAGNLVAGTYTLTVTDSKTCSVSATATLTDPAEILVSASVTGAKCFNTATGTVNTTVTGGFPPYTYLLNGSGQSNGNFTNLPAGNYVLIVSDANGCQGTTDFTIASPGQISVDLGTSQQVILTGMETQLIAVAQSDTTITHYFWYPDSLVNYSACANPVNCPAPYVYPRTTTTFTVFVMNADSCLASDTITITVLNQPSAFIPTAFTPNGDGLNDYFEFDLLGATNINISIYNRWGQRVYYNPSQPNGITNSGGWDGKVDGKPAPDDTYVYRMSVTYWNQVTKDFSGTVTIMK
jgi:gliding motility-associated-like protein